MAIKFHAKPTKLSETPLWEYLPELYELCLDRGIEMTINRAIEMDNSIRRIKLKNIKPMFRELLYGLQTDWEEFYNITLPSWYYKNVYDKVRHYWYHESCRSCRNWAHEARLITFGLTGRCALLKGVTYESDYCPIYNLDLNENILDYTTNQDGCERTYITEAGRKIVQVSKCGIWMYKSSQEE